MQTDPRWTLYVGAAPEQKPAPPLQAWVQELASGPRQTVGELEDCPLVEGAAPKGWLCAVIPEYIRSHTFVASAAAPEGKHVMLFFSAVGEELHEQERPPKQGLISWFHIRLISQVINKEALLANLRHAFSLLLCHGVLPSIAEDPAGDA